MENLEQALQEGSELAFREMIHLYQKPLQNYVSTTMNGTEKTEDIINDAFLILWSDYALKHKKIYNAYALLYQITHNLIVKAIRKERIHRVFLRKSESPSPPLTPMDIQKHEEKRTCLFNGLRQLSIKDREILTLYYIEEMSMKEISIVLNIGVEAISSRLRRARNRLQINFNGLWSK